MTVFLCGLLILQSGVAAEIRKLADLTLEELMNESVTSVSKMKQRRVDAAAAITVLTNEDIRHSGATVLPEALRLVPGLDVASVNSSEWAVSARGFNDVFSKKLLVLIDGRAVYNPITAGVFWDLQQPMLDDLDRIEVIRGPGASVWGANAVNGVINIVSRDARETQGGLIFGGGGNGDGLFGGARYGGKLGDRTYYRIFATARSDDAHFNTGGQRATDTWRSRHGGIRIDHFSDDATQLTWQAEGTDLDWTNDSIRSSNLNTLGRWTRQLSEVSSVEIQVYYDRLFRKSIAQAEVLPQTFDFTAQHNLQIGPRNNLVWGIGYRYAANKMTQTNSFVLVPNDRVNLRLYSAFLQDEFQLIPEKLAVTAGLKLEHNDYTGSEFQPGLRTAYKLTPDQTLWSAISRSVRTPNTAEGKNSFGAMLGAPFAVGGQLYVPTTVGNSDPEAEVLWAYEAGYRTKLGERLSLDVATFYNDYDKLISYGPITRLVPGTPFGIAEIPALNLYGAKSYGGEASVSFVAGSALHFTLDHSYLLMQVHTNGVPLLTSSGDRSAPRHQTMLRTTYTISPGASIDLQVRRIQAVEGAPGYTTADIRIGWTLREGLELSVVGQNLFQRQHAEQGPYPFASSSESARGAYGKLTWRF